MGRSKYEITQENLKSAISGLRYTMEMYHADDDRAADVDYYIDEVTRKLTQYDANGGDAATDDDTAAEWRVALLIAEPVLSVIRERKAAAQQREYHIMYGATEPQIAYLRSLGYRGPVDTLTKQQASQMIDARLNISADDNDDFE